MTLGRLSAGGTAYAFHDARAVIGAERYDRLPYVSRLLAENILRNMGKPGCTPGTLAALVDSTVSPDSIALALHVPRLIFPDSSGIPVLMDLAALRSAVARRGGDPAQVTTHIPIDFVVDHSLQVDVHASPDAPARNRAREFQRNAERYRFLKWAQTSFGGVRIFPPGSGIIHQINLEQIASVTLVDRSGALPVAFPDFVLGGDSHTPMVNSMGVLGWGVGGIEAETVALGHPYVLPKPECVGVRLDGRLPAGTTVTDLALEITNQLRAAGVVGACVEYFGPTVPALAVPDRATLANMAPEYGATVGFWPVDERTLDYLRITGRSAEHVELVEQHARAAGLFRAEDAPEPVYDRVIEIDLSIVTRRLAGPGKPHVIRTTADLGDSFLARSAKREGSIAVEEKLPEGAVAIAAITSCTNTANPHNMIRAGLVAQAAVARGLKPAPWVKTSLAPGSRAVGSYLQKAGLMEPLEALGFHVIGYGCTTCGGKSGPLLPDAVRFVENGGTVAAVLSGNRNFDGRIHRLVGASYLASPALVVAFALAGRVTLDIDREPLGTDSDGVPVHLADLWPSDEAVDALVREVLSPELFKQAAREAAADAPEWNLLDSEKGVLFNWDPKSTYILEPPFFERQSAAFGAQQRIEGARVLGIFADGLTTDHVSPGGEIPPDSPAGSYLKANGVAQADFNTYVGRRGNHEVMARGTYSNLRNRNAMVPDREGWWTRLYPEDEVISYHDAATRYADRGVPLIVLAGADFGAGSSRDWAAKGPILLGVGAVIAISFERIHRSNLIGVGILPLVFRDGQTVASLGLTGDETFSLENVAESVQANAPLRVSASRRNGETVRFDADVDVRSAAEADLLKRGGMFTAALEDALANQKRLTTHRG